MYRNKYKYLDYRKMRIKHIIGIGNTRLVKKSRDCKPNNKRSTSVTKFSNMIACRICFYMTHDKVVLKKFKKKCMKQN